MNKRPAKRLELLDMRPASNIFLTIKNNVVYILIYRYVWQIHQCPGGVIQAAGIAKKYIRQGDGERVYVYAVSEKTLAVGRINRKTLSASSNAQNKNVVNAISSIYNWLHGHSLECLTESKLSYNLYSALDFQIQQLGGK